jgi:hypothetical protein
MNEESEIIRSHCNQCSRETKHIILASRKVDDNEFIEDYGEINWWDRYELLECRGCEGVSMRHTSYFEPTDETTISIYPPKVLRRRPHWLNELPSSIKLILIQMVEHLH